MSLNAEIKRKSLPTIARGANDTGSPEYSRSLLTAQINHL